MLDVYVYDEVQDVESNPQLIKYAQPLQRGGVPISLSLLISSQAQNSRVFFPCNFRFIFQKRLFHYLHIFPFPLPPHSLTHSFVVVVLLFKTHIFP